MVFEAVLEHFGTALNVACLERRGRSKRSGEPGAGGDEAGRSRGGPGAARGESGARGARGARGAESPSFRVLGSHITLGGGFHTSQISQETLGNPEIP